MAGAERDESMDNYSWEHLDYYVRRVDNKPVLIETMMRTDPDGNQEIYTFSIELEELDDEWADALIEQAEGLEEGKSADFVPPDEMRAFAHRDDDEDDEDEF